MTPIDSTDVDISALRKLYKRNVCARALLDHLATRSYNSAETTVARLEQVLGTDELDCSRREIISVLKQLSRSNCGNFVIGRRGAPSRFRWRVQLSGLGKAARGENGDISPLVDAEAMPDEEDADLAGSLAEGTLRHKFNLRPGYEVTILLPKDFGAKEAMRLSEFVKTLPFEAANI